MVGKSRETTKYSKGTLACMGLLMTAVAAYLYFLNMSVVQVVMRTEHMQRQHELNADIALLESKYIEAQHAVASRIASLDGYSTDANKVFVSREGSSLVFVGN